MQANLQSRWVKPGMHYPVVRPGHRAKVADAGWLTRGRCQRIASSVVVVVVVIVSIHPTMVLPRALAAGSLHSLGRSATDECMQQRLTQ